MKHNLYPFRGWTLIAALSGIFIFLFANHTQAARPLGKLPNGRQYVRNEIKLLLKTEFAQELSPADERRHPVDHARLRGLHSAIVEIKAKQTAAKNWLEGRPLPHRLNQVPGKVPQLARNVTAMLEPGVDAATVLDELRRHDAIEHASLNMLYKVAATPNDPDYTTLQWGPQTIGAEEAWDIAPVITGIRIAIVDTGVDLQHPDLASIIVDDEGFADFDTGDAPSDGRKGSSHGTHVAGIAAAIRNNNQFGAGIASARIMAMNCACWSDDQQAYLISNADDAINEAVLLGADVINCSFGSSDDDLDIFVYLAVDHAVNEGVLVVAAAGNANGNDVGFAIDVTGLSWDQHPSVLIVSNTKQDGTRNSGSNYGDAIDLGAPGTGIWSTLAASPATGFMFINGTNSGTSMAAPHVAGAAAMVKGMNPSLLSYRAIQHQLYRMADANDPSGNNPNFGFGRLRLDPVYLQTLKDADAFVGNVIGSDPQCSSPSFNGSYDSAYATIDGAICHEAPGSTLVFTGVMSVYPALTISTAVTLKTFPDVPITIGE